MNAKLYTLFILLALPFSALADVEALQSVTVEGADKMTFGPSPDAAYSNPYKVVLTGANGTVFTEDNLPAELTDFRVEWDVKGFQTANDQAGQYCDSYGAFSVNGEGKVATTFELRNTPMNFYGRMVAQVTWNGKTVTGSKYVVALGNTQKGMTQVLPQAGYPADFSEYDDAVVGAPGNSILFGGWGLDGSDNGKSALLRKDSDGTKYIRITAATAKKSHVFNQNLATPQGQYTFRTRMRFNTKGAVVTFTSGYPMWQSKNYTCPITLEFTGAGLTLNGTSLKLNGTAAAFKTGAWYDIELMADKTTEHCYARVWDTSGTLLGETESIAWAETSSPTYFSIGFSNSNTGTVDLASCSCVCDSDHVARKFTYSVEAGYIYNMEITYQGTLTTGYWNTDLAGYTLGTNTDYKKSTYQIAAVSAEIELQVAAADATSVAKVGEIVLTKQAKRSPRKKPVVHHIGDSTSANKGSWAYTLGGNYTTEYPELAALCDFSNRGRGGRNLSTYYTQGNLAAVLLDIYPGDIVVLGNMGTNGMGASFEEDVNLYLNAAEAMGAKVALNSYTPHGCVSSWAGRYNSATQTFNAYRTDSYDDVIRKVAETRAASDANYLGFIEIGMNADAIFNAYVSDYAANGFASRDAAAQAIISCFSDHNHYSENPLACTLMLAGYKTTETPGIVAQLIRLLNSAASLSMVPFGQTPFPSGEGRGTTYNLSGQKLSSITAPGLYIVDGHPRLVK